MLGSNPNHVAVEVQEGKLSNWRGYALSLCGSTRIPTREQLEHVLRFALGYGDSAGPGFFGYFWFFGVFFLMVLCAWMLQKLQESQG